MFSQVDGTTLFDGLRRLALSGFSKPDIEAGKFSYCRLN